MQQTPEPIKMKCATISENVTVIQICNLHFVQKKKTRSEKKKDFHISQLPAERHPILRNCKGTDD